VAAVPDAVALKWTPLLPPGYKLTALRDHLGEPCGCYTAHSARTHKPKALCRAHGGPGGNEKEYGTSCMLEVLMEQGVRRDQILLQFPDHSAGRRVSRKPSGRFSRQPDLYIDVAVLCDDGTLRGYEVNDKGHSRSKARRNDDKKIHSTRYEIEWHEAETLVLWKQSRDRGWLRTRK
jgi:hypothetical protein